MPTAARLAAAVSFAIFGWYMAEVVTPFYPQENPPSFLIALTIALGVLCGWTVYGNRAGRGYIASIGTGLTAAIIFGFWTLLFVGFYEMIDRSLRRFYDGPMEALVEMFGLMADIGWTLAESPVVISLLVGGIIAALFAEYFAKRYP